MQREGDAGRCAGLGIEIHRCLEKVVIIEIYSINNND